MTQKKVPNVVTGGVDVEVGGQKYTLLLSNRIIMEIEEEEKINLYDPNNNMLNPNTKLLTTVLYQLLKRAGCPLSFDQVLEFCGGANRTPIQAAILTAMGNALPTQEQIKILDPTLAGAVKKAQLQALKQARQSSAG